MGKRKERRLAAMTAANRRVKLDLFAEPSGEMMGSLVHDEIGGDLDEDRAGVLTSPSSSGQKQENPLLLLGQYSDDELDEEEASKQPTDGSSSTDLDGQIEELVDAAENIGGDDEKDDEIKQESDLVDTFENLEASDVKGSDCTNPAAQCYETDLATQISDPESSAIQADSDLTGGWKMIMHEESSRYYYWNTITGETSWEVPTTLGGEHILPSTNEATGSHLDVHTSTPLKTESVSYAYVSTGDGLEGSDLISKEAGVYGVGLEMKNENVDVVQLAYDANQSLTYYSSVVAGIPYADSPDFGSPQPPNNVISHELPIPIVEHHASDEDKEGHLKKSSECYETAEVHSAPLVQYSESLLQRLEALDRSGNRLERHEWITKEIDFRLSDCKALASYGSSLLPFWRHTEAQLKQLEYAISNIEAWVVHSKHDSKFETLQNSSVRDECSLQSIGDRSEVIEKDKCIASTVGNSCSSPGDDASKVQLEAGSQMPDKQEFNVRRLDCGSTSPHLGSEQGQESVLYANPNSVSADVVTMIESQAEDVDMDVEMEVDDDTPSGQTAAGDLPSTECSAQLEQLNEPNVSSAEFPPVPIDDPGVPPPPEEEWIPPPPPDSELVPPPPPEEPPVPSIPPSTYADTILCPPYPDQYNLGYTVPYQYYTPIVGEIPNGTYYGLDQVSHITESQQPPYYEPVAANALPEVAVDASSVEPVAYYDISSGAVPPGAVVSGMGSSGYSIESASINYDGGVSASDHIGSVEFATESGSSDLRKANLEPDTYAVVEKSQASTSHIASFAATVKDLGTSLVNGTASDAPTSTAPKTQTKARSKKRSAAVAPTLRSNKKVSSLVDKWKAAKEELHGHEDEEPENAYEALEKKRLKEIEEWRARQIATGEAQDNANFLPLGGDWRQKVKRKKAEAKTEAVKSPSEVVDNKKKQPDLVGLSKDLPSGWQAYWDESTEEVYYGNSITSETTWTRPTR